MKMSAITAATKANQKKSIFGWKRSGGRLFSWRRGFLFSDSGIAGMTSKAPWMFH
jgi:hypothetical protein